jgi:hypothetical protein
MLMDVIPLDASLVKGSHGRRVTAPGEQPVFICDQSAAALPEQIDSTEVAAAIQSSHPIRRSDNGGSSGASLRGRQESLPFPRPSASFRPTSIEIKPRWPGMVE